jgi:hypothetical protein
MRPSILANFTMLYFSYILTFCFYMMLVVPPLRLPATELWYRYYVRRGDILASHACHQSDVSSPLRMAFPFSYKRGVGGTPG